MGPGITSEERAAASMRAALFSCWANGIGSYLWWCAFDQDHLDFAPYRWTSVERELGLFTSDGKAKPTAVALRDFRAFLGTLPFRTLPSRRKDAVVVLSETQDEWKKAQGAWLLARRAGIDISYALAEGETLPDAPRRARPASNALWRRRVPFARSASRSIPRRTGWGLSSPSTTRRRRRRIPSASTAG